MAGAVSRAGQQASGRTADVRAEGGGVNWLADKRAEINRDKWIEPDAGKVTFGVYAATWIKERNLAETTAERYDGILRNHVAPYLGDLALSVIKEPVIRQWRKKLQDAGVGAATVAKAYRMVHSIFNTAVDDLLIRRNPCPDQGCRSGQGRRAANTHD